MKKKWKIKPYKPLYFIILSLQVSSLFGSELDRQFAIESVGALQAYDNVDGLFIDYVKKAQEDFFLNQSRFRFYDLTKANITLTKSKLPFFKLIDDTGVLKQIVKSFRVESLIRTKIIKEGKFYRFTIDWLHAPALELMASESFVLEEPEEGRALAEGNLNTRYQKTLENMIQKVPFKGHITGRDGNQIIINLGHHSHNSIVHKGDTLVVSSLYEVKKHPLLNSIVDWKLAPIGKLQVDSVESSLAFCNIVEEEPGKKIAKYQKISEIIPAPIVTETSSSEAENRDNKPKPPALGYGNGELWFGTFSRQYSTQGGTSGVSGNSLFYGTKVDGELWLTKKWFTELTVGYGLSSYSQKDLSTGSATTAQKVSQNAFHLKIDVGYNYYTKNEIFGPKVFVRAGYKITSYTLPASNTEFTSPTSFKSPFLGVGGEFVIREKYIVKMSFDYGVFTSAKETTATLG
ncbi:MAG: hypothetical protein HY843_01850, partial [Bdellovibrio sp.]|nr:hypothetical protein [Bdellovibrio sp.]